jgi:predicted kinase
MTKLIIICGLPGTGKTTLADELSKKTGIFCLHKDSIKEVFYEGLNRSTLEDSKKLGNPSVKAILRLAEENLIRGIDVILESPFNFPDDEKIFKKWKDKYDLSIFTIILQLDEAERERRFTSRERHRSHHDKERIRNYREAPGDYQHMPEKKIFITTDKPVSELTEMILELIS